MGCQLVPAPKISYMQAPRVGGLGLARVTPGAPPFPSGAMNNAATRRCARVSGLSVTIFALEAEYTKRQTLTWYENCFKIISPYQLSVLELHKPFNRGYSARPSPALDQFQRI